MKKLVAVLLGLAIALTVFAGCQKRGGSGRASGDAVTIGFAQCKADESDWRMANTRSFMNTFNVSGYRLLIADSNNDAAKQLADVQGFINMEVDYIVIAAVNMDGWDTVLRNAKNAGIPVILVDRNINAADDLWTTYIGPDFKLEGEKATGWMEKNFGSNPVNIFNLQGQLGSGAQVGRSAALDDAVAKNSNWTLRARQTGNWGTDTAKQIMTSWIQQYRSEIGSNPTSFVAYAENDNMADGAIQALQEAGLPVGRDNGVAVISFDANKPYLQMTLAGLINCNVECNPLHGPAVKSAIERLEKKEQVPKWVIVEEEAFFWDSITQTVIDARQY
ncbi:MAG: ABC transporter substrate-binding protein [Treponema sp.]|nr:ABC transporter substrate-binding protein [Treponema sp.]